MNQYSFKKYRVIFFTVFLFGGFFFVHSRNVTVELSLDSADLETIVKEQAPGLLEHFLAANVKAVIFDMDGTIFKSENVWGEVTQDFVAKQLGRTLTDVEMKYVRSLNGRANSIVAQGLKEYFKFELTVQQIATAMLDEGILRTIDATQYIEGFEQFIELLLKHKIPVALATNADIKILAAYNAKMNLGQYFGEHMYSFEHSEGKTKPDPAVFLLAAKKLGYKPDECLVFEDSHPGFVAAQAAGMRCIAIENDRNINHRHLVHAMVPHFNEVHDGLKKLVKAKD